MIISKWWILIDKNYYTTSGEAIIKRNNLYPDFPFLSGMAVVHYNFMPGNRGMIDTKGTLIVPPIFDNIYSWKHEIWIARYGGSDKLLYINRNGDIIY